MPTTNPVPSTDPTDLLFNAGKLDEVVNGTANSFTDRLGVERRTVAGMNADFDAQLADAESDLNVYRADAAASAAEALGYLQTIRATSYGAYAEDPTTDPLGNPPTVGDEYFNTTSNLLKRWNGTTWQASDINTANLAAPSGSSLVGYDGGTVQDVLDSAKPMQSYAALRNYTGRASAIRITTTGIDGPVFRDDADTTSLDNGGTVFIDASGRRWKRPLSADVMLSWFLLAGDGVTVDTEKFAAAVNASVGRKLLGDNGKTYLIQDTVQIPSFVDIDLRGATIKDDVQGYWDAVSAGRAKPLFEITGSHDLALRNFNYISTATRASAGAIAPTGVFWLGDNRGDYTPTYNIKIENVTASNVQHHSILFSILGNVYNVDVKNIEVSGNCYIGINTEYGFPPTETNKYGQHPYNIEVENFNGSDNTESIGFLRVAGCYNVKFKNCYGKNVKNFIYGYSGDSSISRVSQNVVFENCSGYGSGLEAADNIVTIYVANKVGGTPLPLWANLDDMFTFVSCNFKNNNFTGSSCLRFFGNKGKTKFTTCTFEDSYNGVLALPIDATSYTSTASLTFDDCVFKNNDRDVSFDTISQALFNHCTFKNPKKTLIPVALINSVTGVKFEHCDFSGIDTNLSYISIAANCPGNIINYCIFSGGASTSHLALLAKTYGTGNRYTQTNLCVASLTHYMLIGEPATGYQRLADYTDASISLDAKRRNLYLADLSTVSKTITYIASGENGDEIIIQSTSTPASVTFKHFDAGAPATRDRIICPGGADVTKTGTYWTARLNATPAGWVLTV